MDCVVERCNTITKKMTEKKPSKAKYNTKYKNDDKILNIKTGRYVLKTGAIGKKILIDKYKIKETLSNGNCFYSAIYRSLKYKNLLNTFYQHIPILTSKTENHFIEKTRLYVSNLEELIKDYNNLFINIKNNLKKDGYYLLTLSEIMKTFGDSRIIIKEFILSDKFHNKYINEFIKDIQYIIKSDKTYVGQIEVLNFIKVIEKCGIKVYRDKKIKADDNSINLILTREHWEYI